MGNLLDTNKRTKKPNGIAFVEKKFFISKTVCSNYCEPCPWLFIWVFL